MAYDRAGKAKKGSGGAFHREQRALVRDHHIQVRERAPPLEACCLRIERHGRVVQPVRRQPERFCHDARGRGTACGSVNHASTSFVAGRASGQGTSRRHRRCRAPREPRGGLARRRVQRAQLRFGTSSGGPRHLLRRLRTRSSATAVTIITPVISSCTQLGNPRCVHPVLITVIKSPPTSDPATDPSPPESDPPPITTAAITSSSSPAESVGSPP